MATLLQLLAAPHLQQPAAPVPRHEYRRREFPSVRLATAYSVLFLATLIVGAIINYFIGKMVRATGFSGTDRTLGLLFGVARGTAIIIIAIMLARLTVVREDAWWKESLFVMYLEPWAEKAQALLPDNLDEKIDTLQPSKSGGSQDNGAASPSSP